MPLKVIVITNCYPNPLRPYFCMFVQRHVQFHRESGLQVSVVAPRDSRQGAIYSAWKYVLVFFQVVWLIFTARFDVVHAHYPFPAGLLALILSRTRRKPLVITSHGAFVDDIHKYPWPIRQAVRLVLRQADAIIAVGEEHKRNVQAVADIPPEQQVLIDMGVANPRPMSRAEARQLLGLAADEKVVLFIGNLARRKGADILLQAVAQLRDQGLAFQTYIGGQGEERASLEALAQTLALTERVHFLGGVPHDDVYVWFAAADVSVVPSRTEPFGLTPLESMSCNTPVIAANVGGLAQNIRHGENGWLFPVEDAPALAAGLRELLTRPDLCAQLVTAGRKTAAAFDMRLKADQVRQVYESVAHQVSP